MILLFLSVVKQPRNDHGLSHYLPSGRVSSARLTSARARVFAVPVHLQAHMDTICLPDVGFSPGADCVVAGWGRSAFRSADIQTVLKSISLPVVDDFRCESALRRTRLGQRFVLHDSFLCAGGRAGKDACTGDGGSALACEDPLQPGRYVQLGIVSWGIGCGTAGLPGVYADVRQFTQWIAEQMAAEGLSL